MSPSATRERVEDLTAPEPPRAPYFDDDLQAWVLSRYRDVAAALHDPACTAAKSKAQVRGATLSAFSAQRLAAWQSQMESMARSRAAALPPDRAVDLVGEFAEPWCAEVAFLVLCPTADDRAHWIDLARVASAAAADPDRGDLKEASAAANAELDRRFAGGTVPMAGTAFVALSQTLPAFLAAAWLALLRDPAEFSKLYERPDLMPTAVEELLRFAGLARRILRVAQTALDLGGQRIAAGQRLILLVHSANRDPEQFTDPNRLDVTRRATGHLALGAGPHSCAGGSLIRMAAAAAISAFVEKLHAGAVCEPVEWRGGRGFRAPAALYVRWPHFRP